MDVKAWKGLLRLLDFATQLLAVAASVYCIAGAAAPWGQATLFQRIPIHLPGAAFQEGAIVIGAASGAIALRRWRLLGLAFAWLCVRACADAAVGIPREIRSHIIGAQIALFPVNRLLDQARIPNVSIAPYNIADSSYLDYGIAWVQKGATYLALAAGVGLPFDPAVGWVAKQVGRRTCRNCRMHIPILRNADYCPNCGFRLHRRSESLRCRVCLTPLRLKDNFCAHCGTAAAHAGMLGL